ncbi:MAG: hypothetical protein IPI11_13490 [Haliscomenobacter sp.]|nr:hypothetical protein [Haliscomenobacter sp.]
MLTNRNLVANMLEIRAWMSPLLKEGRNRACPLPLYHILPSPSTSWPLMGYGTLSILVTNARDLPSVIKVLKSRTKVSVITG